MADQKLPVGTVEFYRVVVTTEKDGQPYDPTNDLVDFQFVAKGAAVDEDAWEPGTWETVGDKHYAMALIGSGAHVLEAGTYQAWVRVTDTPEIPRRMVGHLRLT